MKQRMREHSWRPGCPVPLHKLRLVRVSHLSFKGTTRRGPLVVHRKHARDVMVPNLAITVPAMGKGIEPIDPTRRPGPLMRGMHRLARTDFGRGFGMNVAARVDPHLLRLSRGRLALTAFFPLVRLVTIGRKSGEERIVPLLYFTQGQEVILVASSFGRERHPAWYLNVRAEPRVELIAAGGRRLPYLVRETEGTERQNLLELADRLYGGYGDYLRRTEGVREIPVLALGPRQGR